MLASNLASIFCVVRAYETIKWNLLCHKNFIVNTKPLTLSAS